MTDRPSFERKIMKSLAHPDWPYTGTPHEWRGFVPTAEQIKYEIAVYQKQNFGPELT